MSLLPPPERDLLPAEPGSELDELEAIIEEARRRARRRRRRYGAWALVVAAAGLVAYFGFSTGGSARSQVGRDGSPVALPPAGGPGLRPVAGIEGGSISAVAVDPQSPETVFAGTPRGLFRSTDGGGSWQPLTAGLGATPFVSLAIAPADPQTVYAGTGLGVFKTTDGGATWRAVNDGLFGQESAYERGRRLDEGYVQSLVVDARDPETVYAGTYQRGLFRSTNGGASWQRVAPESVVAVDPSDSHTIYAVGNATARSAGIFKSTDAGDTWRTVGPKRKDGTGDFGHLAIDPQHSQALYASTDHDVLKSMDGGRTWRATGPPGRWIGPLVIDPQRSNRLYLGTDAGIFKSRDGGGSWSVLRAGPAGRGGIDVLALDPSSSATLYAGTGAGVLKSTDSGRSWEVSAAGMTAAEVDGLAAPSRGSAYALVPQQGLFKRAHGSWRPVLTTPTMNLTLLAVDPQSPETVYVTARDGPIFRTRNGGDNWTTLPVPTSSKEVGITALVIDPQNPNTLYVSTYDEISGSDGIVKTRDGGATWHVLEPNSLHPQEVSLLAIDPRNPNKLHAAGTSYFHSDDGGATWTTPYSTPAASLVRAFGEVGALALDPSQPATMYLGSNLSLYKTTDAGATWRHLKVSFDHQPVNALAVNPRARHTVYAGNDHGLFVSTDGGKHWQRYQGGELLARGINDLAIDPSGSILYIGGNAGVFELSL